jgi:hypothetical protein
MKFLITGSFLSPVLIPYRSLPVTRPENFCPQISECFKIMFLLSGIAINAVISI